eukprot:m.153568 g.153568  ORF g.153568 m.153568 type:complete len:279 (-) comp17474_c1_seq7:124-960(-)
MSQLTFTVLTERGRRHVVKVAATDLVQVILNKACQKQGMDPSKYTLKSGRRMLDLNQPVRFSKLANNAKLEVAPGGTGGGAKSSHVMLQTDGGERLSHEFDASASLWDVLSHWNKQRSETGPSLLARTAPDGTPLEPVCQYTQRQFVSEATLRATTLQSLGLAGGRGAVRLSFRPAQVCAFLKKQTKYGCDGGGLPVVFSCCSAFTLIGGVVERGRGNCASWPNCTNCTSRTHCTSCPTVDHARRPGCRVSCDDPGASSGRVSCGRARGRACAGCYGC